MTIYEFTCFDVCGYCSFSFTPISSTPTVIILLENSCLCIFSQGEKSERGDSDPLENQTHKDDQCPQTQPSELSPPPIPESNKEEEETKHEKSQLSSSVIIDMPNVQSSLELSTITGKTSVGVWFSDNPHLIPPTSAIEIKGSMADL